MTVNREPLVSIIIPCFNAAPWIRESVSSALGQSHQSVEVIAVDDGSTDDTAVILAEFSDPRLHVARQKQEGAASARNRGIEEASGSLIQFLDADDVLSVDKISLQVNALAQAPRGSIASCEWMHLTQSGIRKPAEFSAWAISDPIEWLVQSLLGGGMMQPAGWLTPREIVDAAGPWNQELTLHDDGDFFARVLSHARSNIFVDGARVLYRDRAASLSRRRDRKAAESAFRVNETRESVIFAQRDDKAALDAVATQFAQFAYEFSGAAPDLVSNAIERMEASGGNPRNNIGGTLFRVARALFGPRLALRYRELTTTQRAR